MGALWTAGVTLVLLGTPLFPTSPVVTRVAASPFPSENELAPRGQRLHDPRDGRMITYCSTGCCGSLVCGGCTCIPLGFLVPIALVSAQSVTVLLAGLAIGAAISLGGLAISGGSAGAYAIVLIWLHNMGMWDSDAAAQACNDVLYFFSMCWSFI